MSSFAGYESAETSTYLGTQCHGVMWPETASLPAAWPICPPIVSGKVESAFLPWHPLSYAPSDSEGSLKDAGWQSCPWLSCPAFLLAGQAAVSSRLPRWLQAGLHCSAGGPSSAFAVSREALCLAFSRGMGSH